MVEIIVKSKPGDVVVAKDSYTFMEETVVSAGEAWKVEEIFGYFVRIERNGSGFWLGDNTFVELFE